MKKQYIYILCMVLSLAVIIASAILQYRINGLERDIASAKSETASVDTGIRVMKAEIMSLLSISRIRALSSGLSDMKPIGKGDVISIFSIPLSPRFEGAK